MDEDFDKKIDVFLSLIEEYKFNLKMVKIATKITQLRNAITSNNLHYIEQLTDKIRKDTDFEGIPYIEKATNMQKIMKIKNNAYYLIDRLSVLAFKNIAEHEFGKKIDELSVSASIVYKTLRLLIDGNNA